MLGGKLVMKCMGCTNFGHDNDVMRCTIWNSPETKWRLGECPSATHIERKFKDEAGKVRVGQQKQSKAKKKK